MLVRSILSISGVGFHATLNRIPRTTNVQTCSLLMRFSNHPYKMIDTAKAAGIEVKIVEDFCTEHGFTYYQPIKPIQRTMHANPTTFQLVDVFRIYKSLGLLQPSGLTKALFKKQ